MVVKKQTYVRSVHDDFAVGHAKHWAAIHFRNHQQGNLNSGCIKQLETISWSISENVSLCACYAMCGIQMHFPINGASSPQVKNMQFTG